MPNSSENQRDSFRCPIDRSRCQAQMRFGGRWIPVELLDESAGGFGIHAQEIPEVAAGDKARLRFGDKCFEVEIMHVTQCSDGDNSQNGDADTAGYKLGVRRLGEVYQPSETGLSVLRQVLGNWYRPHFSLDGKGLILGLVVAFCVGVLPAIAMVSLGMDILDAQAPVSMANDSGFKFGSGSFKPKPIKIEFGSGSSDHIKSGDTGIVHSKPSALNKRQKSSWKSLLEHAKLQVDIEPWKDAVLAMLNNLLQKMGLSDLQKAESKQVLEYADQSLAKLEEDDSGENKEEVEKKRASILENAYASLMHVFNDKQQEEWDELVEKQDEKPEEKKPE